jgi:hypothetical protein
MCTASHVSRSTKEKLVTRKELLELHSILCQDARNLMEKKNNDYAGASGQTPFANFQRCEALGVCSAEVGLLTRMLDKFSRLTTFVREGKLSVEDEGVRDTLLDMINYSVLLMGLILEKKEGQNGNRRDLPDITDRGPHYTGWPNTSQPVAKENPSGHA